MKIEIYKENIYIKFNQEGNIWEGVSKLPHYKTWLKVLKYLKKRGFEVKTPKTYLKQNWGTHAHKVAYKGSVTFCLELMNSLIKIEFGDIKNLWKDWEFNFWSLTDDRSTQLTYLESKRIELEVKKLLDIFSQEVVENHNKKLTPSQKILKDKYESCHSHKKEKLDELGLDGIVFQMDDYDHGCNSKDKNEKKINCGKLKYFYDYKKRLCCGKVYHNLNNMWWVLTSDNYYNIVSFDLFDYNGQPRRKELTKEQKINRLEEELREYERRKNYTRCISINKQIEKLKATEPIYNIWSLKWNKWWGANNSGYTDDKRYAGVYLESNILANQSYYNNGTSTKAVLI